MIFPFISGILNFRLAPVTWSLLLLQFLVYFLSIQPSLQSQAQLEEVFKDPVYTEVQGRLFAQLVLENPNQYPASTVELSRQVLAKNSKAKAQMLGNLAWRDFSFLREADRLVASEDPVISSWWKSKFQTAQQTRDQHPTYILGVSDNAESWRSWISYQFSHSGGMHLFSNMIFLLIFGSALEVLVGGLGVLVVFLGSGAIAAAVFLLMDEPSAVPLIGASGAVSGLMALFAFLYWDKGVRFLYFLLIPKRGYLGFVYLPGWVILFLWALGDVAGYFASPSHLGGVAHSAHLGGELAGLLIGLTVYLSRRYFLKIPMPARSDFVDVKPVFTVVQ